MNDEGLADAGETVLGCSLSSRVHEICRRPAVGQATPGRPLRSPSKCSSTCPTVSDVRLRPWVTGLSPPRLWRWSASVCGPRCS